MAKDIVKEPVILGNKVIFYLRSSVGNLSAKQRAQKVSEEIEAIAKAKPIDIDGLGIEQQEETSSIVLKDVLVTLTQEDFNLEEGSRKQLESKYLSSLEASINEYRRNRGINPVNAIATISLIFFFFWLIIWPFYFSRLKIYTIVIREWINKFILRILKIVLRILKKQQVEERESFLEKYKLGKLDNTGKLIEHIYHYTNDYIICRTSKLVQWLLNKDSEGYEDYKARINDILKPLTIIESQNPEEIDKVETINLLTAKGIKVALEGDIDTSKEILEDAGNRLKLFRFTYAKLRYLIDSFYAATSIIFMVIFLTSIPRLFTETGF